MAQSFLSIVNGVKKLIEAITTSAGAADDGKIPALDATGRLDQSFMPLGVAADTLSIEASENLSAGDFVNIWDDTSVTKVRKADATAYGKKADGYVTEAYTSGQTALVYFENVNDQLSGMSIGAVQYLSDSTPGAVTETAPTANDSIIQVLGKAASATTMAVEIDSDPVENKS